MAEKPRIKKMKTGRWLTILPGHHDPLRTHTYITHASWATALYAVATWYQAKRPDAIHPSVLKRPRSAVNDTKIDHYVNHIVFVLDESSSMHDYTQKTIEVVDNQVAYFAQLSKERNQETRITIYAYADRARCIVWDMDVLRAPSIREYYKPYGNTAMIDASLLALNDARKIPEMYGDHAHLIYVFTDGQENASGRNDPRYRHHYYGTHPDLIKELSKRLTTELPPNVTVGCMVPNQTGVFQAKQFGFPAGNIAVWDATTEHGMEEADRTIRMSASSYMTARSSGTRSVTNLFTIDSSVVNAQTIAAANLKPVPYDDYNLVPIPPIPHTMSDEEYAALYPKRKKRKPNGGRIDEFVQNVNNGNYQAGQAFYQLVEGKTERIQADKHIVIVDKDTRRVYFGPAVRRMLGLSLDHENKVKPTASDKYLVYVQSKAPNRKLVPGCHLLIFNKTPRGSDYQ